VVEDDFLGNEPSMGRDAYSAAGADNNIADLSD